MKKIILIKGLFAVAMIFNISACNQKQEADNSGNQARKDTALDAQMWYPSENSVWIGDDSAHYKMEGNVIYKSGDGENWEESSDNVFISPEGTVYRLKGDIVQKRMSDGSWLEQKEGEGHEGNSH